VSEVVREISQYDDYIGLMSVEVVITGVDRKQQSLYFLMEHNAAYDFKQVWKDKQVYKHSISDMYTLRYVTHSKILVPIEDDSLPYEVAYSMQVQFYIDLTHITDIKIDIPGNIVAYMQRVYGAQSKSIDRRRNDHSYMMETRVEFHYSKTALRRMAVWLQKPWLSQRMRRSTKEEK